MSSSLSPFLLLLLLVLVRLGAADKLLVLYVDALHWRYVEERLAAPPTNPPADGLLLMRRLGAHVRRVSPVFPTQCLPNIHSAFTGRLPREHGVLGNQMYDSDTGFHFSYFSAARHGVGATVRHLEAAPGRWWRQHRHAEPLWETVGRTSGRQALVYHLPSVYELKEVERRRERRRGGRRRWRSGKEVLLPYRHDLTWMTFRQRVLQAVGHLRRNVTEMAVVYSDALDQAGHKYGPDSDHVARAMRDLDALLHTVVHEVLLEPDLNIHVMLMSDHGMQTIAEKNEVNLEWFILRSQLDKLVTDGTVVGIWPRKGYENEVYTRLVNGLQQYPDKYSVLWKNDSLIERYFGRGPSDARIPPMVVVAKGGCVLITEEFPFPRNEPTGDFPKNGLHGYHPRHENMQTPMLVFGPKIVAGKEVDSMHVTDMYHLMANILGVTPRSHNASFEKVKPLLKAYRLTMSEQVAERRTGAGGRVAASAVAVGLGLLFVAMSCVHLS